MRFEQNMQQKQIQKLAMTQQLQQSIQILQYNTEDLRHFLEMKSLENPLLSVKIESDYGDFSGKYTGTYQRQDQEDLDYVNQIPDAPTSLFEFLIEQIHLNYRKTPIRKMMLFLAEYIDSNGYLKLSLEEAMAKNDASYLLMLDALTLLQQLDPAGVGARNLQECLLLQIERDNEAPNMAYIVVEEYFEQLASRKWEEIAKKYAIQVVEIQEIFDYIQTLSPSPGAAFEDVNELYIVPDLIVKVVEGKIQVLSTRSGAPKVQFQQKYFDRMQKIPDKEVQNYMKEKKVEFDWIKKSIEHRGDTILRVGTEIVQRQQAFFLNAARSLFPMTLKEIAEALEIHESTVSRAVNGKYLQTHFGTFELRSFFTTGIAQNNSTQEVSASNVKQKIAAYIANENKLKPLSDNKIVDLLAEEGVELSRRTVAKYRDILGIASSSKRKRYE